MKESLNDDPIPLPAESPAVFIAILSYLIKGAIRLHNPSIRLLITIHKGMLIFHLFSLYISPLLLHLLGWIV